MAEGIVCGNGRYATRTRLCTPARAWAFASVTHVGVRPTVDGQHHGVEAHLLDFPPAELPDNLYGQILSVEFIPWCRAAKSALIAWMRSAHRFSMTFCRRATSLLTCLDLSFIHRSATRCCSGSAVEISIVCHKT